MPLTKRAAAIRYIMGKDRSPKIVAKGRGYIAEKIIEAAKANKIPQIEDENLVQALEALDLDAEIPVELYRTVAEILAFIYRLNGKPQK